MLMLRLQRCLRPCLFVALLWLWWGGIASAATPPPVKVALVVGHNRGTAQLKPLRFAQSDAARLARLLRELGGYKAAEVHLLLAPTRAKVRRTMQRIAKRLQAAGRNATFLFYFSGHAEREHFLLGAKALPFREVARFVKGLPVRVRLMIVDSCYSGRLIQAKGQSANANRTNVQSKGASRRAFVRWVPHRFRVRSKGLAILTSSGARERSYESARIRSSFFTSSLLAGLRGAADRNQDQRVSLAEIRQYVYARTIAHAALHRVQIQRPAHKIQLQGQGALFLTFLKRAEAQVTFAKGLEGHLYVYRNSELVHEFAKPSGRQVRVGLRAGVYQVQLRWKGWLGVMHTKIAARKPLNIARAQMAWQQISVQEQVKGGDASFATGLGLMVHYLPVGNVSMHGTGLSLTLDTRRWLSLALRYQFAPTNLRSLPHQTHDLALRINMGYGLGLRGLWFWMGAFVEPRLTWRTFERYQFINAGLAFGATVHLDYHVTPRWAIRLLAAGGAHLVLFDQDTRVAPFFDVGLGFVVRL